jgi:transposase
VPDAETQNVEDLAVEVAYWRERALAAEARVEELVAQVATLAEQVATLSKMLFGRSSEKKPASPPPASPFANTTSDQARKRGQQPGSKGHGRRDYAHLETEDLFHDVAEDQKNCPCCGTAYSLFGDETCEQIDWIVKIIRVVHHRRKYRRNCDCDVPGIVIAPPLPKPIAKGRFTSRFLARLCIDKFVFGTPVNRIAASLGLSGAELSTGTLTGSLKAVNTLLEPLDQAIRARNAQAKHLHVDETSWRVYEWRDPDKKSDYSWLWVFVSADTTVFSIEPARSAKALENHLGIVNAQMPEGNEVIVTSDFYAVYQSLNDNVDGFDSLWCWAHIRRYFIRAGDAHKELRPWRDEWVGRIGALYVAHSAIKDAEPDSSDYTRARESFDAVLADMDVVRKQQINDKNLHEAAHKVLRTFDNEWAGLIAHQNHIELDLDNNTAERALRTPVVGRKNYSGSAAAWSAKLAGRSWTITTTTQQWGLNPLTYFTAYLDACGKNNSKPLDQQALTKFLPWTASQEDLATWREPPP